VRFVFRFPSPFSDQGGQILLTLLSLSTFYTKVFLNSLECLVNRDSTVLLFRPCLAFSGKRQNRVVFRYHIAGIQEVLQRQLAEEIVNRNPADRLQPSSVRVSCVLGEGGGVCQSFCLPSRGCCSEFFPSAACPPRTSDLAIQFTSTQMC
jgi:hypothetical protein